MRGCLKNIPESVWLWGEPKGWDGGAELQAQGVPLPRPQAVKISTAPYQSTTDKGGKERAPACPAGLPLICNLWKPGWGVCLSLDLFPTHSLFFLILRKPISGQGHTLFPPFGISARDSGAVICFLFMPSSLFKTIGQNIPKVRVGWTAHAPLVIGSLRARWWTP